MDKLHIAGWQVYFDHDDIGTTFANVAINYQGRVVTFTLCDDWKPTDIRPLNKTELRKTALHEVVHLLIAPVRCIGVERFITEDEFDTAVEDLTVRLQHIFWKEVSNGKT